MRSSLKQALRLMTRRSRSGQSIIIIALGFMALIAFVGIATDTAMLFVRYSTLRRAVDAAAVAAAGEVRQNATYATMVGAAQEYIRIHGLDPSSVRVDTCEIEIYDYNTLHSLPQTPIQSPLTHAILIANHSELCTASPTKLVRVSAQILSPTSFLGVIGFKSVLLSASSLSQTAVMDVAVMLDASQSMSNDTKADALAVGSGGSSAALDSYAPMLALGLQPYVAGNPTGKSQGGVYGPNGSIRAQCRNPPGYFATNANNHSPINPNDHSITTTPDSTHSYSNYAWGGCCDEPVTMSLPPGTATDQAKINWFNDQYTGVINNAHVINGDNPENASAENPAPGVDYGALICKPFQDVRTSARNFLNKVDFVRGDRVMLITFDSDVHPLTASGDNTTLPVFTSRTDAIYALNRYAGVQQAPNQYYGGCTTLGMEPYVYRTRVYEDVAPCTDTNTGGAIQAMQSLMTDPRWIRRDAVWIGVLMSDGFPNRTPGIGNVSGNGVSGPSHENIHKIGDPAYLPLGSVPYYSNFFSQALPAGSSDSDPGFCPWNTFCDRTGNGWNADRSVAPYSYTDNQHVAAEVDNIASAAVGPTWYPNLNAYNNMYCTPADIQNDPIWWSQVSGNANNEAGVGGGPSSVYSSSANPAYTPYCTSNNPDARHVCMDTSTGVINALSGTAVCSTHYDATDFARDRTDFAALINYTASGSVKGNFIAMFSIFYPHSTTANINMYILGAKFMRYVADAGDNGVIDNHVQQWYRANNTTADPLPPSFDGSNSAYGNTPEDPCAQYDFRELHVLPGDPIYENAYKQNCGNYYYAGTTDAINVAFTDIASRLFTRLAR